jgi:hypothetical protein
MLSPIVGENHSVPSMLHFAGNGDLPCQVGVRRDARLNPEPVGHHLFRSRQAPHMGSTDDLIEPFVPKHESGLGSNGLEAPSTTWSRSPPRLKEVGKIGIESDHDRERKSCRPIVMNADTLVPRPLPEKPCARKMECPARDTPLSFQHYVWVGEIYCKERIVLFR